MFKIKSIAIIISLAPIQIFGFENSSISRDSVSPNEFNGTNLSKLIINELGNPKLSGYSDKELQEMNNRESYKELSIRNFAKNINIDAKKMYKNSASPESQTHFEADLIDFINTLKNNNGKFVFRGQEISPFEEVHINLSKSFFIQFSDEKNKNRYKDTGHDWLEDEAIKKDTVPQMLNSNNIAIKLTNSHSCMITSWKAKENYYEFSCLLKIKEHYEYKNGKEIKKWIQWRPDIINCIKGSPKQGQSGELFYSTLATMNLSPYINKSKIFENVCSSSMTYKTYFKKPFTSTSIPTTSSIIISGKDMEDKNYSFLISNENANQDIVNLINSITSYVINPEDERSSISGVLQLLQISPALAINGVVSSKKDRSNMTIDKGVGFIE